jgi:hypothetical protein
VIQQVRANNPLASSIAMPLERPAQTMPNALFMPYSIHIKIIASDWSYAAVIL